MTKINFNKKKINKNSLMKILFSFMLILSTLITINASSWFNAWMGMEMNLMFFLPLMINNFKKMKISNSMMIYFIIQAGSSSVLFMMIILMKMFLMNKMFIMIYIMQMSLLMKLGAAPFHWWIPKMIKNLSWMNCFILLTWQKIAPLLLLTINNNSMIIYISALLSVTYGAILGLNQTMIKLLISYSSINHLGWMLISLMNNMKVLLLYFCIYLLINLKICVLMNNQNMLYLNQLFNNNNLSLINKIIMISVFFSLAGIPPFLGFLPKLITLIMMIKSNLFIESTIFIFMSMISLSFYINPIISMLILLKSNNKWNMNNLFFMKYNFSLLFFLLMTNLIIMVPMIYNFLY
uniref:NADH-ubiquinone oxidoreductase chain 2 n=1 Tax=Megabeleses liriodendrovorax TaxID=2735432 RepID=A0A8F0WGU4_9HYME|nr:NADH dehydrogenase subunit 2 [Megabeleses liriodendrovorax]QWM93811.1 NADH dehydrogenase subunit 2 [Megabeleses liriodendrovorax]